MSKDKQPDNPRHEPTSRKPKKPPGPSWESFADSLIKKAQRESAFDNLRGDGKPIPDLDEPYDPLWWCKKLVKRKKLSFDPGHLEMKRQVEKDLERVWNLTRDSVVREQARRINVDVRKANATNISGPPSTLTVLDEDEIVR